MELTNMRVKFRFTSVAVAWLLSSPTKGRKMTSPWLFSRRARTRDDICYHQGRDQLLAHGSIMLTRQGPGQEGTCEPTKEPRGWWRRCACSRSVIVNYNNRVSACQAIGPHLVRARGRERNHYCTQYCEIDDASVPFCRDWCYCPLPIDNADLVSRSWTNEYVL